MANETDAVSARLDRAQSQDMELHVVKSDPLLVEVDNEDHGSTHAVIPDLLYCSCQDHQYRNTVCKHLLFLLVQDDMPWISSSVSQSLSDRILDLDDRRIDLERELDETASRLSELEAVMKSVSDSDPTDVLKNMVDDVTENEHKTYTELVDEWDGFVSSDDGVDRMSEELLGSD